MKVTIYDPPKGWLFGFPREYKPLPGEKLEDTLRRDGYPAELLELATWCRFWEKDVPDEVKHGDKEYNFRCYKCKAQFNQDRVLGDYAAKCPECESYDIVANTKG